MAKPWSDRAERWFRTLFLVCLIGVGPSIIGAATGEPSAWDWTRLGVWVAAVVAVALLTVQAWRNRNNTGHNV